MSKDNDLKNELNRRKFLQSLMMGTGALATTSFDMFLSNMMLSFLQRGYAYAAGDYQAFSEKILINFCMSGGLSRWYWDLPMRPNGEDDIAGNANKMLITKFTQNAGAITGGEYAHTKIGDFYMPYVWSGLMPTSDGGSVAMAALSQHMLTLRGINLQVDSHELNRYKQMVPVAGTSLLGMIADDAKTPIPAASYQAGSQYYVSKRGIRNVSTNNGNPNPVKTALDPFILTTSVKAINDSAMEAAIDKALLALSSQSGDKNKFLPTTYEQRTNAKILMKKGFTNLDGQFTALKSKYESLISRSMSESTFFLSGVEDIALAGSRTDSSFNISNASRYVGSDIRTIVKSTSSIFALSSGMAMAEYMIINGLSSAINIQTDGLTGLNGDIASFTDMSAAVVANASISGSLDMHDMGSYPALIMMTKYARAYSACLYELISQLKATSVGNGRNLFDNTAISVNSEFNRTPRMSGTGADHGFTGSNFTIFSGQVPNLTVLGNVANVKTGGAQGVWGRAAGVDELGGREALIGNVASTMSVILDLKSPTPNDKSFVYKAADKQVLPFFKKPKNIA